MKLWSWARGNVASGALLALSLGMAGVLAYDALARAEACCKPGAACCRPGAPCCAKHHGPAGGG